VNLRVLTGIAFIIGGLPKFVAYNWELDAFVRFGLPAPEAWVIAAGIIEIGCGLLLILDRWVVASAVLLGATMAVAIGVSGIKEGDVIPSLTVAPLLLAACVVLLVRRGAPAREPAGTLS
jgi:uncharacterized membrane protein YphA (DoxX/SURF4 family)